MRKDSVQNSPALKNQFVKAIGEEHSKPKKPKARNSSPRITLRLTEEENARLKSLSQGMTVSAYVRRCIFGENTARRKHKIYRPVQDQEALSKVLALLGQTRIANNLNQLAHQANMGALEVNDVTLEKLDEAYAHVNSMRESLIKALGLFESS